MSRRDSGWGRRWPGARERACSKSWGGTKLENLKKQKATRIEFWKDWVWRGKERLENKQYWTSQDLVDTGRNFELDLREEQWQATEVFNQRNNVIRYFHCRDHSGLEQQSPTFLAPGTGFVEESFSTYKGGVGHVFQMIQAHYIYCVLHFYYYYIKLQPQIIRHYIPKVGDPDLGNAFRRGRWQKVGTEVQMRDGGLWSSRTDSGDGESLIQGPQRE